MLEAGRLSQPCCRSSSAKAPVSICCTSSPRAAPDGARLLLGPGEQQLRAGVGHAVGQLALDDVDEQHPALGPVVDAAPGPDLALGVAEHDVLAHPQPALGDLDQHVVDRGAGPAAPGALVGTQQLGEAGDDEPVGRVGLLDPPAVDEVLGVREEPVGVAVEPVVLGDHEG